MAELDEAISNEELFNSALNDLPESPEKEPAIEGEVDTRARDDQGRFASKEEAAEKPKPDAQQEQQAKPAAEQKEEAVPSWRLREIREERDHLRARLAQFERQPQPKPEPQAKPDIFENPDGFLKAGMAEALSPIEQQFASFIETVSRKDAIREHGQERVTEAFGALDQSAKAGDPQALAIVQAVKKSMDPFGDIVNWYRGAEASRNPDAFFQRRLEEALKDDKFKGELMQKLQPAPEDQPAKPVFKVPPSLNRAASAASAMDDGGDLTNESLFSNALR